MYHRIAQLSQVSINHSKRLAAAYSSSQSASIAVSVLSNHYQDEGSGTSLVPLRIVVSGVYQFAKRKVHIVYPVVLFQSSQDGKSYELESLIYIQLRTARMIRRITQTLVITVAKDACGVSLGPDLPRASSSSLSVGNEAVSGRVIQSNVAAPGRRDFVSPI